MEDNLLDDCLFFALQDTEQLRAITDYRGLVEAFERHLEECGYMIVPIEDPTNLRFGVDE